MELGSWLFLTLCTSNPLLPGILVTSKRDEALAAQLLRLKSAKVQLKTGCSVTRESRTGQPRASPGNPQCSLPQPGVTGGASGTTHRITARVRKEAGCCVLHVICSWASGDWKPTALV